MLHDSHSESHPVRALHGLTCWAKRGVAGILLALVFGSAGCNQNQAEVDKLKEENSRLKAEVELLKIRLEDKKPPKPPPGVLEKPDLDLTLGELWTQRFDDNEFRARQRLSNKTIRITGTVDAVSNESVTLYGSNKRFANIKMTINLGPGYAAKVVEGLAALERGTTVSVQGKFAYDKMWLNDAMFVEKATSKIQYSEDLAAQVKRPGGLPR